MRYGHPHVRMPEVAARMVFCAALPFAEGVPMVGLAPSVPTITSRAAVCVREDRLLMGGVGRDLCRAHGLQRTLDHGNLLTGSSALIAPAHGRCDACACAFNGPSVTASPAWSAPAPSLPI